MGFGRRVSLAFRAFWDLLRSGTLPDDIVAAATAESDHGAAAPVVAVVPTTVERPDDGAVLLLSVLQRDGRLIDFLMEDINAVRGRADWCRRSQRAYPEVPSGSEWYVSLQRPSPGSKTPRKGRSASRSTTASNPPASS